MCRYLSYPSTAFISNSSSLKMLGAEKVKHNM